MRRFIALALFAINICLFASSTPQELYTLSDSQYRDVKLLCQLTGTIGPSSSTPVSGKELLIALSRIDARELPSYLKQRYEDLILSIKSYSDEPAIELSLDISPQIFITDRYEGNFSRKDFYLIDYKDEKPGIELGIKADFGENIVLEGSIPFINVALKNKGVFRTSFDWLINFRDGKTTVLGSDDRLTSNRDQIPDNANGSFGNDYFNLAIGRMRHSMGNGFTGNLIVGDNYSYQEATKLAFIGNYLTYTISITHFDQQIGKETFAYTSFGGMHQNRVVHRIDANILNKLRVALNLATMYQAESAFDPRFLTPFIISHNYYNYSEKESIENTANSIRRDESNNLLGIELEAAPIDSLSITLQAALDQYQLKNERQDTLPMAAGLLMNISYAIPLESSILTLWAEGVYTTPYLYLNFKRDENGVNYNYDFILGYNRRDDWQRQLPDISYSGYPSGPDSIVGAFGIDYVDYKNELDISLLLSVLAHGENGINTTSFENSIGKKTPTGVAELKIQAILKGSWQITEGLTLFGSIGATSIKNKDNIIGESLFKAQGHIGLSWKLFYDVLQ